MILFSQSRYYPGVATVLETIGPGDIVARFRTAKMKNSILIQTSTKITWFDSIIEPYKQNSHLHVTVVQMDLNIR